MPRFVLLYHACPPSYERTSHWDFMLESAGVLRTWALERLPRGWQAAHARTDVAYPNCVMLSPDDTVPALLLGDHRLDYLELEGPLSGDRGTVIRVSAGTFRSEHESPDDLQVVLTGDDLSVRVQLSRSDADKEKWILVSTTYSVPEATG